MKFILGKKLGMSKFFAADGKAVPVTLLATDGCFVVKIKTVDKDGYDAVQLGFGEKKLKNISKSQVRKFEELTSKNKAIKEMVDNKKGFGYLKEFKIDNPEELKPGDKITLDIFQEGEEIKVSAVSKGKGFQGVVKRHGFSGFPATHGTKHGERAPGSIGSAFPERVWPGKKMAGRMGGKRVTTKGLKIMKVDKENQLLVIKGAIPGKKGTMVEVRA